MTPNLMYNAIMGVLQGMQMPLYIVANNIALALVDILFNYLFLDVFGWGPAGSPMGINVAFIGSLTFALFYLYYGPIVKDSFTILPIKQMLPWKENKLMFLQGSSLMVRSFLVELSTYLVAVSCQSFGNGAITAVTNVFSELTKYSYFIPSGLGTAGIMLGGYLIGKGKIDAFRMLLNILPICACFLAILFFIILVSTGPYYWTNFFFASDDDGFDSVYNYVKILWWLILLLQPINSFLAVYEGILFATQSFDYVRNVVVIGFTLIFLPLFLIGWFAGSGSLSVIILAQTSYSLFRTICYGYKVHTSLIDELKKQILLEKEEEDHSDDSTNSSTNIELIDSPIHRIDHNS
jgi:Na+-driven multidrug efflux pump